MLSGFKSMALILILVTPIVACSPKSDDANAGIPETAAAAVTSNENVPGPCTLISEPQIESVVAKDVIDSEEGMSGGGRYCTWFDTDEYSVMTLQVFASTELYDVSKKMAAAKPIAGIGDEAHLGSAGLVYVKKSGRSFFAQSLVPLAASDVSAEVRAAASGIDDAELPTYEASLRFAKLIVDRF